MAVWIIFLLCILIPLLDREFIILEFLAKLYICFIYMGMLAFIGLLLYMICEEI